MLQDSGTQVSGSLRIEFGAANLKDFAGTQLGRQGLRKGLGHD